MQTYITSAGKIEVDPGSKKEQTIYNKDGVRIAMTGEVESNLYFHIITSGPAAFTEEAMLAILYHRLRLKHAETDVDQWLEAAKYIEDVEESIAAARRQEGK